VRRDHRLSWDEYSARWSSLHGGVDPRRSSAYVSGWLRFAFATGRGLAGAGISPVGVTALGLVLGVAVPFVVLPGGVWLFAAAALVFLSALADSADGAVAIISGHTSRIGAFYDAMADRVTEAAWLVALWLLGVPGVLVALCAGLVYLHEYARARAALSGMPGVGVVTVAERPTRVLMVIVALVLGGALWPINERLTPGLITVVVGVWAGLGLLGLTRLLGAIRLSLHSRS
jgi:CDP-diacylglycerol--glycerol-3-phosphate 3-phosphatidyltransferase